MVSTKALQEHPPAESFLTQIITEALNAKKTEIDDATAEALKVSEIHVVINIKTDLTKCPGKSEAQEPCRERAWENLTSYSPWTGKAGGGSGKR
jgi:hypothetical protein